jgi:hypothetical protein
MNLSTQALEKQYQSLREGLPAIEAKGAAEEQLNVVRNAIATSRDNLNAALLNNLQDNDPEVAALTKQMGAIQVTLDQAIKELGDVAKILGIITKAVDVGSQLAAKAVAL